MLLKTIIIEDELHSREFLHNLLTEFCPDVQVIAIASSRDEAIETLRSHQPDLVFLDIELQRGTGFEVLKAIGHPDFQVVFTTASDHQSIKAIQFCGANYLLKPIDIESLQLMINIAAAKRNSLTSGIALKHLYATLQNQGVPEHLYIPNMFGGEYAAIDDIIRIEVQEKDPVFILRSGSSHPSIHSLRDYEILLEGLPFFRTHQLHMINLKEIKEVIYKNDVVQMSDGSLVPLSPKRKEELRELQKQLTFGAV